MDEMKIVSKFTRGLISKILQRVIAKKTGCNTNIQLNEVTVNIGDNTAHIHVNIDADISKLDLQTLMNVLNLT
jgi:hypothetical protein